MVHPEPCNLRTRDVGSAPCCPFREDIRMLGGACKACMRLPAFTKGAAMRTLVVFGLGALTMYLLDPVQGRRRRALMRDQYPHAKRIVRERTAGTARDLSNRAQGAPAEPPRPGPPRPGPAHPPAPPEAARPLG